VLQKLCEKKQLKNEQDLEEKKLDKTKEKKT